MRESELESESDIRKKSKTERSEREGYIERDRERQSESEREGYIERDRERQRERTDIN